MNNFDPVDERLRPVDKPSLLSSEQRSVLVLLCVDGLTYKQAPAVLGIPGAPS